MRQSLCRFKKTFKKIVTKTLFHYYTYLGLWRGFCNLYFVQWTMINHLYCWWQPIEFFKISQNVNIGICFMSPVLLIYAESTWGLWKQSGFISLGTGGGSSYIFVWSSVCALDTVLRLGLPDFDKELWEWMAEVATSIFHESVKAVLIDFLCW